MGLLEFHGCPETLRSSAMAPDCLRLAALGAKIPLAGLDTQAVLVDLHLQAVIRACGLHVLERDLEQIQVLHSWLPLTYHTM